MRQFALSLILLIAVSWFPAGTLAFEAEEEAWFGPEDSAQVLRIISTADIAFIAPMITSFLSAEPDSAIHYTVAGSTEVQRAIVDEGAGFDVVISSAMDLQTKLANDGWASPHLSEVTSTLPPWAVWNDMLFAFTQEPAAIVVSTTGLNGLPLPQTRNDLINLLRQHPEVFRGRTGTYDVRQSGLGYLFATQDARASEVYWRLTEVMGGLDARLYCCSSHMIDAVKSGELLIAYNVLGSYAINRDDRDEFAIILPEDFTTVMLRTALITRNAPSPELSRRFIDHLLAASHGSSAIPLTHPALDLDRVDPSLNRIQVGPGLLVFLDQLKRRSFLSEWASAMFQN
ncbi:ABC transporter substrate-binding protein [Thalassobius sp. Cn5-15]|uniref:ABC transporter substrate-binding protein n=1 Tax=Thalassobius sp. Cn5-15 TaxID=2917763 RepID=UPI001EF1C940|nr:ABC transporter substrate-binding protein [Thalassobius sp. Cn5-15]MCG7492159.1 ABC transporter substrate-binding protein [Thalassobius sp. Cn5-15]